MTEPFAKHIVAQCSVPGCPAPAWRWLAYEGRPLNTFYLCPDHSWVLSPDDVVVRVLTPAGVPVERELAVYACHPDCPYCSD